MNVVITGSTKGIGLAMAKEFLRYGDKVVVSSRSAERVEATVAQLREEFPEGKIVGLPCDVSVSDDVEALAGFAQQQLGTVEIWINNAGSTGFENKDLIDSDPAVLEIDGATKRAIPQLTESLAKETEGSGVGVHTLSPGMVLTDLLLRDSTPEVKRVFNILAEKPETVASFLVERVREVEGSGQYIRFLTNPKAAWRFATAWRRKNRFFDEEGEPVE